MGTKEAPQEGWWKKLRNGLKQNKSNIYDYGEKDGRFVPQQAIENEPMREPLAQPPQAKTATSETKSEDKKDGPVLVSPDQINDPELRLELLTSQLNRPERQIALHFPSSPINVDGSPITDAEKAAVAGQVSPGKVDVFVEHIIHPEGWETRLTSVVPDGNIFDLRPIATTGIIALPSVEAHIFGPMPQEASQHAGQSLPRTAH